MLELTSLQGQEPGGTQPWRAAWPGTSACEQPWVLETLSLASLLLWKADASPDTGKLNLYRAQIAPGTARTPGAHPLPTLDLERLSKEGLKQASRGSGAPGACGFTLLRLWACHAGGLSSRHVAVPLVPPWLRGCDMGGFGTGCGGGLVGCPSLGMLLFLLCCANAAVTFL